MPFKSERDFNQTIFYSTPDMVANRQTIPHDGGKTSRYCTGGTAPQIKMDEFKAYLENPLQSTVLVFNYKYGKLDGRKK